MTRIGPTSRGWAPPIVAGYYFADSQTQGATATTGNGTLRACPFYFPNPVTIIRLGAEVTTVGEAGSKVRLGVFNDTGGTYPGTVGVDGGTILGDSATVQEVTVSLLVFGLVWFGAVAQICPTTQPTMRVTSNWNAPPINLGSSAPTANQGVIGYQQASVSGALATFSGSLVTTGFMPRIHFKVA